MKVIKQSFNGINTIGLYGFITDKFALLGPQVPQKQAEELEKLFGVPVIKTTIAGTSLLGVFLAGNEEKIIVPSIAFDHEIKKLKELAEVEVIDTIHTCLGNNVLILPQKIIMNPDLEKSKIEQIEKFFDKKALQMTLSQNTSVGSLGVVQKNNILITHDLAFEEKEMLKEMGLNLTTGTVNMGSPYIKAGLLVNKNGLAIGKDSGGPELVNAETALKNE